MPGPGDPVVNPPVPNTTPAAPVPGFTPGQVVFIEQLGGDTGLDAGVIAAWVFAEENGSAAASRQAAGNHNWLNIGYFDSGAGKIAFASAFRNPTTAADQTNQFLRGTWGGASSGIRNIMNTVGLAPQAQIKAIQESGWASSHYPSLPAIYGGLSKGVKQTLGANTANPGGTAGLGGTGTLPNDATTGFTVGDPSNPDEDYWTAINRIAQERYWYVFSDGETLYLADGPDLMKQTAVLEVDRINDAANVNHLDLTWDNTAWTYAVTHKRRKRTQRRSTLAKVTSPVSATLNYICNIDEVRAGDVVTLSNCGPGDGAWLVGDCRRSVFEISSEIDLVVGLTPLTERSLTTAGVNPLNSSTDASAINAPAKVQQMLALATALLGAPYSQANHAASFTQSVAQVKRLGTDCSGLVSILLGPKGAGVLSSPQTTQTLPSQPGIKSGPGKYVTVYDRATGAVNNEHTIIQIAGTWFESGGNASFNAAGGVGQLTPKQAAGELSSGGFIPFHPAGL